jgi:hypothetical protein
MRVSDHEEGVSGYIVEAKETLKNPAAGADIG